MGRYILALDQGTTGSTAILLDPELRVAAKRTRELPQHYPQPGWVEHDPDEIWASCLGVIGDALADARADARDIAAIGITNQRETTVVWDRASGQPAARALVWQDRRTAPICEELRARGLEETFRAKTGLVLDPYFSGTKLTWLLRGDSPMRAAARTGKLAFGTIDSFLVWRLSGGRAAEGAAHVTDPSNASRTLLFDLRAMAFDDALCDALEVPRALLPEVRSSSDVYAHTKGVGVLPDGIPIAGIAGDQQSALFGQACFRAGQAKCTYGTGAFLLLNTGPEIVASKHRLLTTVAWRIGSETHYALEGSAFIAGAAVQWLRDGLGIIRTSAEVEELARSVPDSGGVTFVPALAGLGAPHWRADARGILTGITRGTTAAHIARATLEGIAFLVYDLADAMKRDLGRDLADLRVDGGASQDDLLMQFQSDLLGVDIVRPAMVETTALGAALLAGLAVGQWKDRAEITRIWREERRFAPTLPLDDVNRRVARWHDAVAKA
jgi:glycerol kinase